MDASAERALARLRDPDDPALPELASMVVAQTTATPLRELAAPRFVATRLTSALDAGTRGDALRAWFVARIEDGRARWSTDPELAGDLLPADAIGPLRQLLGRPYVPDEELVYRLIDQPAIRELVHTVLADTVMGFRRRLAGIEGMLGVRRRTEAARSLLGNMGRNLEGMAQNLVGAVREEVDHALEGRMAEFVEGATREALRSIAAYLANPTHAEGFAAMRLGFLDVLMETERRALAAEAEKLEPEGMVDVVIASVRASLAREDFADELTSRVQAVYDEVGDGSLGAWLAELDLVKEWDATASQVVNQRLVALVASEDFAGWWARLHRPG